MKLTLQAFNDKAEPQVIGELRGDGKFIDLNNTVKTLKTGVYNYTVSDTENGVSQKFTVVSNESLTAVGMDALDADSALDEAILLKNDALIKFSSGTELATDTPTYSSNAIKIAEQTFKLEP